MKLIIPAMNFLPVPQWDFRVFHNETNRDIEIAITHDDLRNDHIIIRDPEQQPVEETKDKAAEKVAPEKRD